MYEELEALEMEDLEDLELEDLGEYEFDEFDEFDDFEDDDLEYLGEDEFDDLEADPFLGKLIRGGVRRLRKGASRLGIPTSPNVLKALARRAAQAAGGAIAGPTGANIASLIASRAIREAEFENGYEYESEAEFEAEFEALGGDWEILDDMGYYAARAAEAESEEEADYFWGALAGAAPMLLQSIMPAVQDALPKVAQTVADAAPGLIQQGLGALTNLFRGGGRRRRRRGRRRRSREAAFEAMPQQAAKALPAIVAKTATALAKQARTGRPITPKKVAAVMAQQTAKTLCHPGKLAKAVQNNKAVARRTRQNKPTLSRRRARRAMRI